MNNINFQQVIDTLFTAITTSPRLADNVGTNTLVTEFRKWEEDMIQTYPIIMLERDDWNNEHFEIGRTKKRIYRVRITALTERMDYPTATGDPWSLTDRIAENIVSILEDDITFGSQFMISEVKRTRYGKIANEAYFVKGVTIEFEATVRFIYKC